MRAVVVAPGAGRFIAVGSAGTGVVVKASPAETGGLVYGLGRASAAGNRGGRATTIAGATSSSTYFRAK